MELPNHDKTTKEKTDAELFRGYIRGWFLSFVPASPPCPTGTTAIAIPIPPYLCTVSFIPLPALWSASFQKHSSIMVSLLLFPLAFAE